MKNIVKTGCLALFLCFASYQSANAQFGKLFDKAKKTVTKATKAVDNASTVANAGEVIKLEGGGTMTYTFKDRVNFELVGVYGKSTSENYGDVYVVLKVKMLTNKSELPIGGPVNMGEIVPTAIDQDGNVYKTESPGWYEYTVSEGLFVKLNLSDRILFKNVKKSVKTLQQLKLTYSLSYADKGILTLSDVPVQWGVEP